MMVSFCAVLFCPRDVLDEILDLLSQFQGVFLPTIALNVICNIVHYFAK